MERQEGLSWPGDMLASPVQSNALQRAGFERFTQVVAPWGSHKGAMGGFCAWDDGQAPSQSQPKNFDPESGTLAWALQDESP